MKHSLPVLLAALVGLALCCTAPKAAGTASVWDGVYTADQASRGGAQFTSHCASCHGASLTGSDIAPPLAGNTFLFKWSGNSVGDLVDLINTTMPSDSPGSLDAKTVTDITAYMLSVNQFPAGATELPADPAALKAITINATKPADATKPAGN